jgi:hypothetical protein
MFFKRKMKFSTEKTEFCFFRIEYLFYNNNKYYNFIFLRANIQIMVGKRVQKTIFWRKISYYIKKSKEMTSFF